MVRVCLAIGAIEPVLFTRGSERGGAVCPTTAKLYAEVEEFTVAATSTAERRKEWRERGGGVGAAVTL